MHRRPAVTLAVVGLLALLLLLPSAILAQGIEPVLTLEAPAQAALGEPVTIRATLTGPDGSPIGGALVRFVSPASFLSYRGEIAIGEVRTDATGTAVLSYSPTRSEQETVIARFMGAAGYASAEASAPMSVTGSGTLYQEEAGIKVPGIGVWVLAAVLGTVWSVFVLVFILVTLIARAGVIQTNEPTVTS